MQEFLKSESVLMSWKDADSVGDGRGSIWLSPTIAIYFKFVGERAPEVNPECLHSARQRKRRPK